MTSFGFIFIVMYFAYPLFIEPTTNWTTAMMWLRKCIWHFLDAYADIILFSVVEDVEEEEGQAPVRVNKYVREPNIIVSFVMVFSSKRTRKSSPANDQRYTHSVGIWSSANADT